MNETFRELKPTYGTYAVPGNHDNNPAAIRYIKGAGIKVLQDSYTKVADSFYVVGRDNEFEHGPRVPNGKQGRLGLAAILQGVDRSLPIIVLDHQPSQLAEAQKNGVDLQFSGHTHRGQLFPGHLITSRIFEIDWGMLQKGNFHAIVSSGYGTWGPPIRIGSKPEIVDVVVKFR
jgi:predicted MPP superfamily phosphohydrolase